MQEFILFLLATAGLAYGITTKAIIRTFRSNLSLTVREGGMGFLKGKLTWFLDEVLNCPFCCGFWSGLIVYNIIYGADIMMIPHGLAGSVVSHLLANFNKK